VIRDTDDKIYKQYVLDINLEHDLRNLQQKKFNPRVREIEKDKILNKYFNQSVLLRGENTNV
jgi:hypothetical protein